MLVASHYLMAFTYYSVVSDFFVSSLYLHPKGEQIAYLHLLDTKGDEDSELQLTSSAKEKVLETMEINKQKRTVRGGKLRDQMTSLTTGQIVQLKQIFPTSIVWSKIVRLNYFRLHYYYIRVERSYLGHNKKMILQWWKKRRKYSARFWSLKLSQLRAEMILKKL